jgi:hypothetical protein
MIRNILRSSANNNKSDMSILAHKPSINLSNNESPKVGPCDSRESMGKGEDIFPGMQTNGIA